MAAVASLAVTGLAVALPAPAGAVGPGVVLLSLFNQGHDASVRFDGRDGGLTLVAQRLDPAATVTFQVNANPNATDGSPGWTDVAGTPTPTGEYASLVWVPDPALVGTSVAVRAVATNGPSVTYSTRQGVLVNGGLADAEAVAVYPPGTPQGFFDQPYADSGRTATHAAVVGFTSAGGGTVEAGWWNPASQAFQGKVDAQVEEYSSKVGPGTYIYLGTFHADLDITAFDADAGDVLAVGAELDTDDVLPNTLYAQHAGTLLANAPTVPAGQPTTVTLSLYDVEHNQPIAGGEVRRVDGSLVGYTDGAGRVRDVQTGGSLPSYYVNTTDNNAFEPAIDKTATVSNYASVATTVQAVSVDGRVFDDDEYAPGDLYLRVDDQYHLPVAAGTPVSYRIYPSGSTPPATYQTASTDGQGRVAVPFSPSGPDGAYQIDFNLGTPGDRSYRFDAGDSTLTLTPTAGSSAPGGQIAFSGTLSVGGHPLARRRVGISYKRGIELVPGKTADAGVVDGAALTLSKVVTTDAAGGFSFTVRDPGEKPQAAETGGKLTLSTQAAAGGTLTGNPNETAAGTTAFGSKKGKVKIKLKGSSSGGKDKLVVKAPDSVAGEKVKFFELVGGKLKQIKAKKLNKKGDTSLKVADPNGGGTTTYVVKLISSDRVKGAKSKKLKLK